MLLADDLWPVLEERLFPVPSTESLFNQYRDEDPGVDAPDAALLRRENLRTYLERFDASPDLLLVGEAIGYRGGRFSGVPFTSERQLVTGSLGFSGHQTSLYGPYSESTATILRGELAGWPGVALAWNTVPLHVRHPGAVLSNRTPSDPEVTLFLPLLGDVHRIAAPRAVVAVGRKAEAALAALGVAQTYVRHPASGGAAAFRSAIRALLLTHTVIP